MRNRTTGKIIIAAIVCSIVMVMTVLTLQPVEAYAAVKKPAQVINLKKKEVTSSSITVKFKKVKKAKGYRVQVYNLKNKLLETKYVTKNSCKISGLVPNFKYKVKVQAYIVTKKNKKIYGKASKYLMIKTAKKDKNSVFKPGESKNSGEVLQKDYEKWRDAWLKENEVEAYETKALLSVCYEFEVVDTATDDMYLAYKQGTGSGKAMAKIIVDCCKQLNMKAELITDIEAYREKEKNYYGSKFVADKKDSLCGWCILDYGNQTKDDYYIVTVVQISSSVRGCVNTYIPNEYMEYFKE